MTSPSRLATASQEARHVACELFRGRHGREPGSDGARPINQEFREIPLYTLAQQPALLPLEPDIEWVGVAAVDLDLGEQRKRDPIVALAECRDLRIRPRLLMAELVAWEGEDFKAPNCSQRFCRPWYCGVNPHFEATLTTKSTLPRKSARWRSSLVLSRALKS